MLIGTISKRIKSGHTRRVNAFRGQAMRGAGTPSRSALAWAVRVDACWNGLEAMETRLLLSGATTPTMELFNASPAVFVENQGQWSDNSVRFGFNGNGASIAYTDQGLSFNLWQTAASDLKSVTGEPLVPADPAVPSNPAVQTAQFTVSFDGANTVKPVGVGQADTRFNYFVGDTANWRSNVPGYQEVDYKGLYSGIDLHTFGQRSSLKYEFHVEPGADYHQIEVRYDGVQGLTLDATGQLHVQTALGELVDAAPFVYQVVDGKQVAVPCQFELTGDGAYRFVVTGAYDPMAELVLDPDLAWATYLGGSNGNIGYSIAIDSGGNAIVTGEAYSTDFDGRTNSNHGQRDAYVAKVSGTGSMLWATYLGGSGNDYGNGITIDSGGNTLVTGNTDSTDFAGTNTSYDGGSDDVFVAKVSNSGSLLWATYLGGSDADIGCDIALDSGGNALVTGYTFSIDFVGRNNSNYGSYDAFVAKVNIDGSLLWATYLGGNGSDGGNSIAVDSGDNTIVTGWAYSTDFVGRNNSNYGSDDAFVAKVNIDGSLLWTTYLGGSGIESGSGIAVDSGGDTLVTGTTNSTDFVRKSNLNHGGYFDVFVAKVSNTGSLLWASYLGGSNDDRGTGIAVDSGGNALVTGYTSSSNFTGMNNSNYGRYDAFVAKVSGTGSLQWATYLGGSSDDEGFGIAVDSGGNALVTGYTFSADFAGMNNSKHGGYNEAFITKLRGAGSVLNSPVLVFPGTISSPGQVISTQTPTFQWQAVSGADQYGLYISQLQPNGTYTLIFDSTALGITISGSATSYTLPANILQDGGQYRWNMNSHNNLGWGSYSARQYFTCTTSFTPVAPTGVAGTSSGPYSIDVTWNAAAGASNYYLYRSTSATGPWTTFAYTGSFTHFSDFNLLPNTTYYYVVYAVNLAGTSPLSVASASVTTQTLVQPATPANFHAAVAVDKNSITLTWNLVAGASYSIERSTQSNGTGYQALAKPGVGVATYTDTSLSHSTPNPTYYYRLCSIVAGIPSNAASANAPVTSTTQCILPTYVPNPTFSSSPYLDIATTWAWDWNQETWIQQTFTQLASIDWANPNGTIILTHGWNSKLDNASPDSYMNIFAQWYTLGRENTPSIRGNLLAIDWYANGSKYGSDPNKSTTLFDISTGILNDAKNSANNAIYAAESLADKLYQAHIQPENTILIGHSNGAGFMASLSESLFNASGKQVKELVALDAPVETRSYTEVVRAAGFAVTTVENYYMPLAQTTAHVVFHAGIAFGLPMLNNGIINYELNKDYAVNVVGHSDVPQRYASTTNTLASEQSIQATAWGFMISPFMGGAKRSAGLWQETNEGEFVQIPMPTADVGIILDSLWHVPIEVVDAAFSQNPLQIIPNLGVIISVDASATGDLVVYGVDGAIRIVHQAIDVTQATARVVGTTATSVWNASVKVAGDAINGVNLMVQKGYSDLLSSPQHYLNSIPVSVTPAARAVFSLDTAQPTSDLVTNSILAEMDIAIPENATTIQFDFTVTDKGNNNQLLVAIGNTLIGVIDLASYYLGGGGHVEMWIGDYAGQSQTLSFYMPSDVATSAAFIIGNLSVNATQGGSTIDIASGTLIVEGSDVTSVANMIHAGQIISSTATNTGGVMGLATISGADYLALNGPMALFHGQTVRSTDVLVGYTYEGDVNMDGQITTVDFAQIDASYLAVKGGDPNSGFTWLQGDFNYDGKVDATDFAAIDRAFQSQSGHLAQALIDQHTAQFGAAYTAALAGGSVQAISPPQTLPQEPSVACVTNLYHDLLGRDPESAGLASWSAVLKNGNMTVAQIAAAFTNSTEYRANRIRNLYQTILGRTAESAGLNSWVSSLAAGNTLEQVTAGFYGSAEYASQLADRTPQTLVRSYYQSFLGRSAEDAGLNSWVQKLNTGTSAGQAAYAIMVSSEEGATKIVNTFYQNYLHRNADPNGLAHWVALLRSGVSQTQILVGFVGSPEYYNRV